jgi:hypothetical protein
MSRLFSSVVTQDLDSWYINCLVIRHQENLLDALCSSSRRKRRRLCTTSARFLYITSEARSSLALGQINNRLRYGLE